MCDNDKCVRIHLGYWIFMLLMSLIFVITARFTDARNFTSYIGNASVLISLVLGLVAIFYSFVSNNGLAQVVGTISQSSSSLQESRRSMDMILQSTVDATRVLNDSASSISKASEMTLDSLEKLGDHLNDIKTDSAATRAEIAAIRDRVEAGVPKPMGNTHRPEPTDAFVDNFLKWGTINANLLCYASVLAAESGKILVIKTFCDAIKRNVPSYSNGFLACMHACDLVTRESEGLSPQEYKITYCADALSRLTRAYLVNYAESIKDSNAELRARITESVSRLEAEFGS